MNATSSSSQVDEQPFSHQIEKDYSIQCDDVSELVSVAEFKHKCREFSEEVSTTHVIQEEVDREITEACKSVKNITKNIFHIILPISINYHSTASLLVSNDCYNNYFHGDNI